jgi:hypothetical protein
VATLASLGLSVTLPNGWDGRIYQMSRRGDRDAGDHASGVARRQLPAADGAGRLRKRRGRGHGPDHVFVVLLEHHPATATTALFQQQGMALPLGTDCFSPAGLQRALPGQSGAQFFFNEKGRAYSLYVVLGSHAQREQLVSLANSVLQTVEIAG